MINFAVINLKSTIKNLSKIIIVLLLIIGIVNLSDLIRNVKINFNYIDLVKSCIDYNFVDSSMDSLQKVMFNQEMPILAASNNIIENDFSENISVASSSYDISETNSENQNEVNTAQIDITQNSVITNENLNLRNLPTEVISENNISESYNTLYGSVKIKNETSFTLTQDILTPNIEFTNKTDVVIFHTHTCESYTPTEANSYVASRKL